MNATDYADSHRFHSQIIEYKSNTSVNEICENLCNLRQKRTEEQL